MNTIRGLYRYHILIFNRWIGPRPQIKLFIEGEKMQANADLTLV
jgi:hypothetical protein